MQTIFLCCTRNCSVQPGQSRYRPSAVFRKNLNSFIPRFTTLPVDQRAAATTYFTHHFCAAARIISRDRRKTTPWALPQRYLVPGPYLLDGGKLEIDIDELVHRLVDAFKLHLATPAYRPRRDLFPKAYFPTNFEVHRAIASE